MFVTYMYATLPRAYQEMTEIYLQDAIQPRLGQGGFEVHFF